MSGLGVQLTLVHFGVRVALCEPHPETIIESRERFATDPLCRDYLAALRWPQASYEDGCHSPR
jgi:hypothetical protein